MTSHLSPILTLRKKSGLGVLKQFSTSVTWIGLPLFFLFYSHSAWVFASEHAMDHVRFYKGEYSFISRFYTSQRNSSKDLELFR